MDPSEREAVPSGWFELRRPEQGEPLETERKQTYKFASNLQ